MSAQQDDRLSFRVTFRPFDVGGDGVVPADDPRSGKDEVLLSECEYAFDEVAGSAYQQRARRTNGEYLCFWGGSECWLRGPWWNGRLCRRQQRSAVTTRPPSGFGEL